MRLNRRVTLILVACLALTLVGIAALGFNTRVADHFGYALPGAANLPSRIAYANRHYSASGACSSSEQLRQQGMWPLRQVTQIPTLLGAPHPVMTSAIPQGMTTMTLMIPKGQCYAVYTIEGGP